MVSDMVVEGVIIISDQEKNGDIPRDFSGDVAGINLRRLMSKSTKIKNQLGFKFPGKLHGLLYRRKVPGLVGALTAWTVVEIRSKLGRMPETTSTTRAGPTN